MSTFQRFPALIRRELAEHRRSIVMGPIWLAGGLIVLFALSMIWNGVIRLGGDQDLTLKALLQIGAKSGEKGLLLFHEGWMLGLHVLFRCVMIVVIFTYAVNCLFEERKDKSTLFWRSLPVRDWETVLAKAVVMMLVIPTSFVLATFITQALAVLLWALACFTQGQSAAELVFKPLQFVRTQAWQLSSVAVACCSLAPVMGWCLFCSSVAKQRPFLMAMILPFVAWVSLQIMSISTSVRGLLSGGEVLIGQQYFGRIFHAMLPLEQVGEKRDLEHMEHLLEFSPIQQRLGELDLWLGLAVGIAFIAIAAWIRRYREDTSH